MIDIHILSDDILQQIFFRMPVKYLFQRRLVSKTWNRLLSEPSFCSRYRRRLKERTSPSSQVMLGFFQGFKCRCYTIISFVRHPTLSFLPTCNQGMPLISRPNLIEHTLGLILCSSNGLILCGHHPMTYLLGNPVTNKWFLLPRPPNSGCNIHNFIVGLSYEEVHDKLNSNIREFYLVIRADNSGGNTVPIETYSSATGVWKQSMLTAAEDFVLDVCWPTTVTNGIFYWLTRALSIAAYDPNTKESKLWLIRMPHAHTNGSKIPILTESEDGVVQCGYDDDVGFRIFCLRKKIHHYGYSSVIPEDEWSQRLVIALRPIVIFNWLRLYPQHPVVFEYPNLIAFHPQNLQIVFFRKDPYFFSYDMGSSKLQFVQYFGHAFTWVYFNLFPYIMPEWPPSPLPAVCCQRSYVPSDMPTASW